MDLKKVLILCLAISNDGDKIAVGYDDSFNGKLKYIYNRDIYEENMETKMCRRGEFSVQAHNYGVLCVKFTHNGKKIVTGGN